MVYDMRDGHGKGHSERYWYMLQGKLCIGQGNRMEERHKSKRCLQSRGLERFWTDMRV